MLDACGSISVYFFQVLARQYHELQTEGLVDADQQMRIRYTCKAHPVLIARQMLMISATVQYTNPESRLGFEQLAEPPRVVMKRLADTAIRLVSSNDGMMGTIEGLECLILDGVYQSNSGNLRRSWLTWRRAIGVAQLMCLHRTTRPPIRSLTPNYTCDPRFIWYRLVYVDRFLSLMLGLPQASTDISMATESALKGDTVMGQFERRLCAAAGRVLERNERDPSSDDFAYTQQIDADLQAAASTMPSKWWLAPNLAAVTEDEKLFWEMAKLFSQVYHYNLLNQLHLPYMLCSSDGPDQRRFDYSRVTCVNASREVLGRYIMFRSYNHAAFCCRVIDFFALSASFDAAPRTHRRPSHFQARRQHPNPSASLGPRHDGTGARKHDHDWKPERGGPSEPEERRPSCASFWRSRPTPPGVRYTASRKRLARPPALARCSSGSRMSA